MRFDTQYYQENWHDVWIPEDRVKMMRGSWVYSRGCLKVPLRISDGDMEHMEFFAWANDPALKVIPSEYMEYKHLNKVWIIRTRPVPRREALIRLYGKLMGNTDSYEFIIYTRP